MDHTRRFPALQQTHEFEDRNGVILLVRRDWRKALPVEDILRDLPLDQWGESVPHNLFGRGPVHVLKTSKGEIVAKRLQRGGMVGGVARESYFNSDRLFRSAEVAEQLSSKGCPSPPVVAARATRKWGPFFQLEMATARIPGGRDLLDALQMEEEVPALVSGAGAFLRHLHDLGFRHPDLQVKNLLVPAQGGKGAKAPDFAVLDLDKCTFEEDQPLTSSERLSALVRLGRSWVKHGVFPRPEGAIPPLALRAFFRSYNDIEDCSAKDLWGHVSRRVVREVELHRIFWE